MLCVLCRCGAIIICYLRLVPGHQRRRLSLRESYAHGRNVPNSMRRRPTQGIMVARQMTRQDRWTQVPSGHWWVALSLYCARRRWLTYSFTPHCRAWDIHSASHLSATHAITPTHRLRRQAILKTQIFGHLTRLLLRHPRIHQVVFAPGLPTPPAFPPTFMVSSIRP